MFCGPYGLCHNYNFAKCSMQAALEIMSANEHGWVLVKHYLQADQKLGFSMLAIVF